VVWKVGVENVISRSYHREKGKFFDEHHIVSYIRTYEVIEELIKCYVARLVKIYKATVIQYAIPSSGRREAPANDDDDLL
jgi:hypothetical protein